MKRLIVLAFTFSLTACLPAMSARPTTNSTPSATTNILSTAEALAGTLIVETVQSLPTPTEISTDTSTPALTLSPSVTPTGPTSTGTLSSTGTVDLTVTATIPPGSISIDKLPSGTVFGKIVVENSSGTHVDISLQCTTRQGYFVDMEYSEVHSLVVKAPLGYYVYVVYVGGKQIVGGFSYTSPAKLGITIYRDHVAIH